MTSDEQRHRRQVAIAIIASLVLIPGLFGLLIASSVLLRRSASSTPSAHVFTGPLGYVGLESCRECHEPEVDAWRGSHHDLAMDEANEQTVLGDFDDVTFEHRSFRGRFFRRDGGYFVETANASGEFEEFEIAYTFGVTPLQQYLIGFPDGRYQALTVAWDSRPVEEGGQRWFHLYPDEDTPPGDELHWTSPSHNWNHACAECHSTDLQKRYDPVTDTFATTWAEIDVSCESCHGPGSRHVELAAALEADPDVPYPADHGLIVHPRGPGTWRLPEGARNAGLEAMTPGDSEIESCGRCHSRRVQVASYEHGQTLHETHQVALLDERLYHADGQILDEVFVYGSFIQSRMHAVGVTCSDCHDPHSLKIRKTGNALCTDCHAAPVYDTPEHHFHEQGTDGAACVECHMPNRTYMVVDPRRDHSMRIPRPDLTVSLGIPNACNLCHADQTPEWSAEAIVEWYGDDFNRGFQLYAEALHAGRAGAPGAAEKLAEVAADGVTPAIARATALRDLAGFLTPALLPGVEAVLSDDDPFVRRGAAEALAPADPQTRWRLLSGLLDDPVLSVRLAAVTNLLDVRPGDLPASDGERLRAGFATYESSQMVNAERAESWVNLAHLRSSQGDLDGAIRDFGEARRRNPGFFPIYANEADLYRRAGREQEAERVLREGLERLPDNAALRHSLGLLLVRTGRANAAMDELAAAHRLAPEQQRFGYVYGVALQSSGRLDEALSVWDSVLARHPNDVEVLSALASAHIDQGRPSEALPLAERLAALLPDDRGIASLVVQLRRAEESAPRSPEE